jgi:muramidase (phage lysozyme)
MDPKQLERLRSKHLDSPDSSASGKYQFVASTWVENCKAAFPKESKSMNPQRFSKSRRDAKAN